MTKKNPLRLQGKNLRGIFVDIPKETSVKKRNHGKGLTPFLFSLRGKPILHKYLYKFRNPFLSIKKLFRNPNRNPYSRYLVGRYEYF